MKKTYNVVLERLKNYKEEYNEKMYQFKIMVENENGTGCFERNAINDLIVMNDLKSKIKELEHWEMLLRAQIKGNEEE